LKFAEAQRAVRDYRKATGDLAGTIDRMVTVVEKGTEYTLEFGDINEAFYGSLDAVLDEIVKLPSREGSDLYPRFRARILHLRDDADKIGWGYGDSLMEQVDRLEARRTRE
jgi:hypothetical protein